MTPDELDWIDRELGLSTPNGYRALLSAYPGELYDHVADYDLLADPAEVVFENLEVRNGDGEWPDDFFVIGHDGRGNCYCLDLAQEPAPVLFFERASGNWRLAATSLENWLLELLDQYEDPGE